MRATFHRKTMLIALNDVVGVVPSRSPKPILQNVVLHARDGESELVATDLEIGVRRVVKLVQASDPGSVVLPPDKFRTILMSAGDDDLVISVDTDKINIRGNDCKWNLQANDATLFPDVPAFAAENYRILGAADLRRAIRRTMVCVDLDSTRWALGGCLLEIEGTTARLVSSDGKRLAVAEFPVETNGSPATHLNASRTAPVIPAKTLKLLASVLDDDDPPVHVSIDRNSVVFRTETSTIYSRILEGRFPAYGNVFGGLELAAKILIGVSPLLSAVQAAAVATSEESRGVDLTFHGGVLTIDCKASDVGDSEVRLPVTYDGPAITSAFDNRLLTEFLRSSGTDEVTACVGDNASVLFQAEGLTHVICNLTRDR